ncbi:MAG TPA: 1-acyl-sn-glycerol-3-phosphate acyltransferase [Gemmatimonadaceae bacterium]|nr:1-acyl-sn-glycerol-3-phosphate acyltransferase [Gemmatimonadaceae bacterium]
MPVAMYVPGRSLCEAPPALAGHDPFDPAWTRAMVDRALGPMLDSWFRVRFVGAERIPARGPVILTANHSGDAFPYDAIAFDAALWQRDGLRDAAKLRTVYEPELSLTWWMRPFGIDDFYRRAGGVDMTFDNFDRLLARGDRVLYFPEGVPGIGKGFNRRYELQRFHTSFVRLAARHGAPVVPVHVVNGEWIHPFGYTLPGLDRAMQVGFGVPFLPLPIGLLAMLFPWMWYLAFPARLTFVVGEWIDVRRALRAAGAVDPTNPDDASVRRATEAIRETMQRELAAAVARFGREPWDLKGLVGALRARRRDRWRAIPTGWPLSFIRNERDGQRLPARNRLHALLRDLDLAAFYLPLGWPLITLCRLLRKPPYGYRGVARATRARQQGRFIWRLAQRPLPPREG